MPLETLSQFLEKELAGRTGKRLFFNKKPDILDKRDQLAEYLKVVKEREFERNELRQLELQK